MSYRSNQQGSIIRIPLIQPFRNTEKIFRMKLDKSRLNQSMLLTSRFKIKQMRRRLDDCSVLESPGWGNIVHTEGTAGLCHAICLTIYATQITIYPGVSAERTEIVVGHGEDSVSGQRCQNVLLVIYVNIIY